MKYTRHLLELAICTKKEHTDKMKKLKEYLESKNFSEDTIFEIFEILE